MDAQTIIQEALEVAYQEYPKTFLDKLFHREPSPSKIKSSAIKYLTDRALNAEDLERKAVYKQGQIFREALRVIEQFDPKEALLFHSKFSA